MKLHISNGSGQYIFTGYEKGSVSINRQPYTSSMIVTPNELIQDWGADTFEGLNETHFERLLQLKPEVVIFGTGEKLRFPHPTLFRSLTQAQIGIEFMDSQAAARTYNILMAEDRQVVCAILLEPAAV